MRAIGSSWAPTRAGLTKARLPVSIRSVQSVRSMSTVQDSPQPLTAASETLRVSPSTSPAVNPSAATLNRTGVLRQAIEADGPRNTWTRDEIGAVYNTPLMELIFSAVRTYSHSKICYSTTSQD